MPTYITIKVQVPMAETREFTFESPTTVKAVLDMAGLNGANFAIRVSGRAATLNTEINTSCSILLTKKTQGA